MVYHKRRESSMKQLAYAKNLLGGQGYSKKQIALNSGYSPAVANSIKSHIENKPGFHNAMARLAVDSNNLALAAMHEFKARGFHDFTNKELVGALNAIGNAWSKFNAVPKEKENNPSGNKLRTVILQQIENQNLQVADKPASSPSPTPDVGSTPSGVGKVGNVEDPMDF